ncbi:MAG: hypothetical protein KDB27_14475 [Planctomycetales bacterium]|nr:hypothetical protein [Planctomycetales bacterium]
MLLWCAIPLSPNTVDSDFWGHVQYGDDFFQYGLAKTATYTFTAEGYRWINHENLCEITFAWLVRNFGAPAVLVLKAFFGLLVIGLIIRSAAARSVSVAITAIAVILVAVNLSFYWGMRPQVFSFTFFAIVIAICERFLSVDTLKNLSTARFAGLAAGVTLVFAPWANSHGGFVAGVCVFGLIMLCRLVEAALKNERQLAARFCLLGALAPAATLLNPYGIDLHLWLIESLRVPRPEVTEWHAPAMFAAGAVKIWVMLILSAMGFAAAGRRQDWAKLIVFLIVVSQAMTHQRHLPFVAILFGFWVPQYLQALASKLATNLNRTDDTQADPATAVLTSKKAPNLLTIGPLAALCILFAIQFGARLRSVEVPYARYPVAALQYMADHNIDDSIVVTGEWAQYVLAVVGARTPSDSGCRVAFDGRFRTCYPQSVVDMHFDFYRGDAPPSLRYRSPDSPPPNPNRVLEFGRPNLVLVKTSETFASGILQQSEEWCLLYNDRTAELWGRSEVYDQPNSKKYLAASQRIDHRSNGSSPQTQHQEHTALWPAAPTRPGAATAFVSKSGGDNDHD